MTSTALQIRGTIDQSGTLSLIRAEDATDEQRETLIEFLQPSTPLWDIAVMGPVGGKPAPDDEAVIALKGVVLFDDYKKGKDGQYLVSEEGELLPCVTSLWLTTDGRVFHSHSGVAAGWIRGNLLKVYGSSEFGRLSQVKRIRIEKRKAGGGFTFQFRYMPDQG